MRGISGFTPVAPATPATPGTTAAGVLELGPPLDEAGSGPAAGEPSASSPSEHPPRTGWILTLVLALAAGTGTAWLLAWRLATPALWGDESASTMAVSRSWTGLWQLYGGSEAPLMPYYTVLKLLKGWTLALVPSSAQHLEVLERWPSVAVVAMAGALLAGWLARSGSAVLAGLTVALVLLCSSVSRYGQEARPYSFVLALAIASTVLWWQLTHRRGIWWPLLYGLATAAMVAMHLISGSLLVAHVLATLLIRAARPAAENTTSRPGALPLPARCWRMALGIVVAGGLAYPLAHQAMTHGVGGAASRSLDEAGPMFLRLFVNSAHPLPSERALMWIGLAVLPAIGLAGQWFSARYANLTRIALCWAVVPVGIVYEIVRARPNLIATRYVVFVVPGWALLAALGLLTITSGVAYGVIWVTARIRPTWPGPLASTVIHAVVVTLVLSPLLVSAATVQRGSLKSVRSRHGHSEDFRTVLAVINRPQYRRLPIEIVPIQAPIQFGTYAPTEQDRLINYSQTLTGPIIWPTAEPSSYIAERLSGATGLIILMRGNTGPKQPQQWDGCQIVEQGKPDPKWSYMVLARTYGPHRTCDLPKGPPTS